MNQTWNKIVAAMALATCTVCASAAPISVTDTMTLNLAVTNTAPKSFTINLNDNGTAYLFGLGSVTNANLHLTLDDPLGANEKYAVFLGSSTVASLAGNNINGIRIFDIILDAAALADLSIDGLLTVRFEAALQGQNDNLANYLAVSSRLEANPAGDAAAVPEPGSLGLMGITLAGLAAVRRRKPK